MQMHNNYADVILNIIIGFISDTTWSDGLDANRYGLRIDNSGRSVFRAFDHPQEQS